MRSPIRCGPRLLLAGLLAIASCDKAKESAAPPPASPPATVGAAVRGPTTHPGCFDPGDTVEVRIGGLPTPDVGSADATVRVQADGAITLPILTRPVAIAYLDPAAAAARITAAYERANILRGADVSVRRIDYPPVGAAATQITLAGRATTRPGVFDAGDLLAISLPGLSTEPAHAHPMVARVGADGLIGLPMVGDVAVGGLDRPAAARAISDAFVNAHVLQQPSVSVRLLQVGGTGGVTPGPIGVGDLVRCLVTGLSTEPTLLTVVIVRVDAHGDLSPTFLAPVHVAGLTDGAAAAAVSRAYRDANILQSAVVSVLTLERAPADAEHLSLPDGPVQPVPEPLRFLYETR